MTPLFIFTGMYSKGVTTVLIFAFSMCKSTESHDTLKENILSVLRQQKGTFAVAFSDLQSGEVLTIRGDTVFHAASTIKTSVMIEVYKQVAAGKFSLNDSIPVKNEFKSIVDGSIYTLDREADSESELYDQIGKKKTVAGLVQAMIVVSSNLATNIIIELVGAENANQTMRSTGTKKMRVLRGVEDSKAFEKNLNNVTTASDLMVVFEKIARGEIVSPEACGAMIAVLSDQHFNEIIPKKLPPGVKVAHKTGNITGVQHDSGIIFLPDGRKYVLVLLSKDLEDEKSAIAAMADVSRLVYDHMTLRDRR